jgi:hypothetical protein
MNTAITRIWVLPLVLAGGCVDLGLLDELGPFDAGATGGGGASDTDGDTDADTDTGGPPATDSDDATAPAIAPISCTPDEQEQEGACVATGNGTAAIRFATDEPAEIGLVPPAGVRGEMASDPWAAEHLIVATGLSADAAADLEISLADVNGNAASLPLPVLAGAGPTVAITEVLADPFGPEPAQELVEIANYGAAEVDLSGWMIDDNGDANGDLLPAGCVLAPGRVALLVAPDYDPACADDPPAADGALIILLGSSLATNGLSNEAVETVELYDAAGAIVSRYDGRLGDPAEGRSAARLRAEAPDGCPRAFGDAPVEPTPGAVAFVP